MSPIPKGLRKKFSPQSSSFDEGWLKKTLNKSLGFTMKAKPGVFHASSLGEDARVLLWRFLGIFEEEISAQQARKMGRGTAIHTTWAKDLQNAGVLVVAEKPVNEGSIHGRLDFIVRPPVGTGEPQIREVFLLELKSQGPFPFGKTLEPDYRALCQWTFYSYKENIPKGYIIYESMDTQDTKYFYCVRENKDVYVYLNQVVIAEWPNLVNDIFEKTYYVTWCASHNALPDKCAGCIQGCRYPKICEEQVKTRKLVTLDEWRLLNQKPVQSNLVSSVDGKEINNAEVDS